MEELMSQSIVVLAIIGTVSAIKSTTKIQGWVTVIIAVAIGAFAGMGAVEGMNIYTGVLSALAAVGTVSVVDRFTKTEEEEENLEG